MENSKNHFIDELLLAWLFNTPSEGNKGGDEDIIGPPVELITATRGLEQQLSISDLLLLFERRHGDFLKRCGINVRETPVERLTAGVRASLEEILGCLDEFAGAKDYKGEKEARKKMELALNQLRQIVELPN